jgi:hypothetical protein
MGRRVSMIVVAGALAIVLLLAVASAGDVHVWHSPPAQNGVPPAVEQTVPVNTIVVKPLVSDGQDTGVPDWLTTLVLALLAAGAIWVLVGGVRMLVAKRTRLRLRRPAASPAFAVLPDVATSVSDDAAEHRAALVAGSPRNAIVACWLRLERSVADAGLQRDLADTSVEFTSRVLGAYSVDRDAIVRLAALYREARFSSHEMDETHRRAALDALDTLHAGLRQASAASSATVGSRA